MVHRNTQTALICCVKTRRCSGGGLTLLHPRTHHLCALVPSPALLPAACLLANDSDRGWKTHSDSRQRSDFSLGMCQGFGHKSQRIHIYQTGTSFCPADEEDPEWGPSADQPLLEYHSQGQPNVCPSSPLNAVPPPRHGHGCARKALTCAHTHSTLPSTLSRTAAYNSPGPHQTESPAAPFEK